VSRTVAFATVSRTDALVTALAGLLGCLLIVLGLVR
jgi:hypothetical protein